MRRVRKSTHSPSLMTQEELERIQAVCREWLRQSGTANGSRLTIPAGEAVVRAVELEVRSLLTFDNVLIASAVDADTGACYLKLIAKQGESGEFIETPLDRISLPAPTHEPPTPLRGTQKRYQEGMKRFAETQQSDANESLYLSVDTNAWLTEKGDSESDQQPRYLLYTNGELLGYSLLERVRSGGQRSGRFHPDDNYFAYAPIFEALPQAENDWFEANAREAYGIVETGSNDSGKGFIELSAQVDALKLYLEGEDRARIKTAEVRLEDLSRHYDDETERWLHVTLDPASRQS